MTVCMALVSDRQQWPAIGNENWDLVAMTLRLCPHMSMIAYKLYQQWQQAMPPSMIGYDWSDLMALNLMALIHGYPNPGRKIAFVIRALAEFLQLRWFHPIRRSITSYKSTTTVSLVVRCGIGPCPLIQKPSSNALCYEEARECLTGSKTRFG